MPKTLRAESPKPFKIVFIENVITEPIACISIDGIPMIRMSFIRFFFRENIFEFELDFLVQRYVKNYTESCRNKLSDNCCYCRALNSHFGNTELSENENRVKDDVQHSGDGVESHTAFTVAVCLMNGMEQGKHEHTDEVKGNTLKYVMRCRRWQ